MNELIQKMLDCNHIYTARTGMGGTPESIIHRWKNGEKIKYEIGCRIEPFATFASGNNLFTCGAFSAIASTLRTNSIVGRYTEIATGCNVMGPRHPIESVSINSAVFNFARENVNPYFNEYEHANGPIRKKPVPTPQPQNKPLIIGNDVWIGSNCTLSGVTIHTGAVVASNSVVVKDVPPYAIVAGVPAKIKKFRFPPEIIHGLLEVKWWEYELGDMYREELDFSKPDKFLSQFINKIPNIRKYVPKAFSPFLNFVFDTNIEKYRGSIATYWGTVLMVSSGLKLTHGINSGKPIIGSCKDEYIELIISRDGMELFLENLGTNFIDEPSKFIVEKNIDGTISVKCGEKYLSARPHGGIDWVKNNREWEHFIVIE